MKRFLCGWLCLCLLLSCVFMAFAEDAEEELTEEEKEEVRKLDEEDDSIYEVTGRVYPEPTLADFDASSPAIYTGRLGGKYSVFAQMDSKEGAKRVSPSNGNGRNVDILYVGLQWLIVRTKDNKIGYVKREWFSLTNIKAVDPVNTPPFNAQKHAYTAVCATTCHVRKTMDPQRGDGDDGNNWVILNPGTNITIWQFYEGWAMVNYMRSYGYIDPNELTDLKPVSPTDEVLYEDCPIAAYTSYYKMVQSETNISRIHNIKMGCGYISVVLQPGQEFNANKLMGPYNPSKKYQQAPVMIDGNTVPGYGGGTCQVSSTLYNVLVQLPKIEIKQRRAHGGNGASYLPIHCDAAVGSNELNLRFVNGYDFAIRIEALSNDDGALSIRIYKAE